MSFSKKRNLGGHTRLPYIPYKAGGQVHDKKSTPGTNVYRGTGYTGAGKASVLSDMNKRAMHDSTHPVSPAKHGPGNGQVGNPYHDKEGKFTSK